MLNFRKLKQDFSSNLLQQGKDLHDQKKIKTAKILKLDEDIIRFSAQVSGNFENAYESEIEIDRFESETIHSNCDCTHRYDCQHIAALIFYLEENIDAILIEFSKEKDLKGIDSTLLKTIKAAKSKEEVKKDLSYKKQITSEYINSSEILAQSPFFLPEEGYKVTKAQIALIYNAKSIEEKQKFVEFSLALRIPSRSKPLNILNVKNFFDAIRYEEKININSKNYFFKFEDFSNLEKEILKILIANARFTENLNNERSLKIAKMEIETFGDLLTKIHEMEVKNNPSRSYVDLSEDLPTLPHVFASNLETPLHYSFSSAIIKFEIKYLDPPSSKVLLFPTFIIDQNSINITDANIFESSNPSLIHEGVF